MNELFVYNTCPESFVSTGMTTVPPVLAQTGYHW